MRDLTYSPGELEAQVRMLRTTHNRAVLLVEGPDDSRFWRMWVTEGSCEVLICGGKSNALGALARVEASGLTGVVAVVDDDCDSLLGRAPESVNACVTHARDLECMLLQTGALGRVLVEYGDPARIQRFEREHGPVVEALLTRALPFGRLRWLARRESLPVDFKRLHPRQFTEASGWRFDPVALHAVVVQQGHAPDLPALEDALRSLGEAEPWKVAHGHDTVRLLSIGLHRALGDREPGEEVLARALRLAVDHAELQ